MSSFCSNTKRVFPYITPSPSSCLNSTLHTPIPQKVDYMVESADTVWGSASLRFGFPRLAAHIDRDDYPETSALFCVIGILHAQAWLQASQR